MKKLLLVSTALVGVAMLSTQASAAVKLDLGGYFAGYAVNSDDEGANLRETDLRHDSEVYVSGETTLDNGLTVGFHTEQDLGGGGTQTDEVYAYFSGGWGRVNLGNEDGAAYLLQVGAPGADTNTDGMRTYIQGFSGNALDQLAMAVGNDAADSYTIGTFNADGSVLTNTVIDYDNADFRQEEKITYLTPKFNGFQAGFSYAPEDSQNAVGNNIAAMEADNTATAINDFSDDGADGSVGTAGDADYENIWEVAARWDGEFQGVGIGAGVGFSSSDVEAVGDVDGAALTAADAGNTALNDGVDTWNAGLNLTWNSFSLGGAYVNASTGYDGVVNDAGGGGPAGAARVSGDIERDTWVVGLGWDNGPWHVGGSYLNQQTDIDGATNETGTGAATDFDYVASSNEVDKFTVGAGYTFGPGMSFRGSIAWGEYENTAADGADAGILADRGTNDYSQVAIGTDIQF